MITFGGVIESNGTQIQFHITGDGAGNVCKLALNKPPFSLTAINPTSAIVDTQQQGLTANASIAIVGADTILTLTFSGAIPSAGIAPVIVFTYNSLP